jgi:hypothetical protein
MLFFVFHLLVNLYYFYRRRKRDKLVLQIDTSMSSSLQTDKVGDLRAEAANTNAENPSPSITSPFNRFRGSIAWTEGFETNLHILAKDQYPERAMGVFTSGGDAQGNTYILFVIVIIKCSFISGMNPAVRAIVRMGIYLGCKVYFIHEVWRLDLRLLK